MASQQQHTDDSPAAPQAGPLGETRTLLPAPANDNRGSSIARRVLAALAAILALTVAIVALHPFG